MPRRSFGAQRAAQRFLSAYLRWETGDDTREIQRELEASATPQLLELLTSGRGQPQTDGQVPRAKLTSLIAGSVSPARAATIAARLTRDGRATGLAMIVKHRHGRWLVTSVGR